NGDSSVIGRTIGFEDKTSTVVGVMPADFYFPTPAEQYWATLGSFAGFENRSWWFLRTIGRLSPNVEISEAQRELSAIARRIDLGPEGDENAAGVYLETRLESYVGDAKRLFAILLGAVAVVLAIACANIANLGLTRAATRQREYAIRAAVGAARLRLIRQLLAENLALALIGAAVGVGIAHAVVRGLLAIGPANLPRQGDIGVDAVVLLFATAIAVGCGLIFGLVPALHASRLAVTDGLRDRGPGVSPGIRRNNTLKMLVVAQIGLSQVLVVAAGLLLNSFLRLSAVRPGFDTDHTLTMQIHLPRDGYDAERVVGFHRQLAERLEALPGVHRAGLTSHLPFSKSDMDVTYFLPGDVPPGDREVKLEVISEDYLRTMGIPLLMGRHFDSFDRPDQPLVAIINQRMAEMHWTGTNAMGQRFTIDDVSADDKWITVVGVVGTVLKEGLTGDERPQAYLSLPQFHGHYSFVSGRHVYLAVRAGGVPENMVQSVRREIAALDARVATTDIRSTAGLVADAAAEPRFRTILIGSFAVLALLVALVGIYGVMGFVVAQRRQEIGIRMALGASSAGVLKHVLLGGTRLIVLGVAVGTVVAIATSRTLSGMLFGLSPSDPVTFLMVTMLLGLVALGACYIPARRASQVDPMGALRVE
ncbi:MAG: ADOP family duplicated permease, partial [Gemmatimonadales bacterium]